MFPGGDGRTDCELFTPACRHTCCLCRLIEVINEPPGQLYLIFEFIDKDLKKYLDKVEGPLDMSLVKVRARVCVPKRRRWARV